MSLVASIQDYGRDCWEQWDRFWFTPRTSETLSVIRVLSGAMLLYTHFIWTFELDAFFGTDAWIPVELSRQIHANQWVWTYLWWIESGTLLWVTHLIGLLVIAAYAVGWQTRWTSIGAWFVALNYCHRSTGALFGLDQVNVMLVMYLMLCRCGDHLSVDRWLADSRGDSESMNRPTVSNQIATRLIQLHLCIIYLFGGIGKLRGAAWWDGSAVWMSVANYEYQSLDMTWLAASPVLIATLTHITVLWETFYGFLVWNRFTRPIVLLIAVAVHGGICLFLGMITFGLAMIFANMSFIEPEVMARLVNYRRNSAA